jgi:hypothetical protein
MNTKRIQFQLNDRPYDVVGLDCYISKPAISMPAWPTI